MACEYQLSCTVYGTMSKRYHSDNCDNTFSRGQNCQLYQAWEENAQLKKQIADGGLEEKAKEDEIVLGQMK